MPLLKALELQGYKTFASRTMFEFPGMVTAVVGPNGSGKSNIADALRWVLGEQSYSLLRGRKTEDMIFSGSELRPRAGMAQATVIFDNETGWLPIDYSEVSISRRAYRDGQNEYLLNGQRVRLKEITELLAQSGLAERTYTIIGQGLVDAALSLKPEERRRFFEEAAGIGLYRSRREEALNRLDTTRRNLERVLDILSELEPRMRSLEKQARRAMEYEQIRADLRLLLRDWYGYHWHRTQREMLRAREVVRVQDERLAQARERMSSVDARGSALRAKVHEVRNRLNELHARSAEVHSRWEKISRDLAVMDERRRALDEQLQTLQNEQARLEDEHRAREERLQDLSGESERLTAELGEARERTAEARKRLEARLNERNAAESRLRDLRRDQTARETRLVQLKAHQSELAHRVETLRASRETLAQSTAREVEEAKRLEEVLAQWARNRESADSAVKSAEEALRTKRLEITALDELRRKTQDERSRLDAEKARLTAQVEVLEQAERSLSGLAAGARFLLQEARQGRLKGAFRAFGSQLIVPAEFEGAIGAALGETFDSVLLERGADLDGALAALAAGEKGRAVLLPLDLVREDSLTGLDEAEGVIGRAADLVQSSSESAPAVEFLLGGVWVARDRSAARNAAARLPRGGRVVTLQGEVFHASGMITAGRDQRAAAVGQARRRKELAEALEAATQKVADIQNRLKNDEATLAKARGEEKELDQAARQAAQQAQRAAEGYRQASLQAEQARQRREFQARQTAAADKQIENAQTELRQTEKDLAEATKQASQAADQVREAVRALSALPADELQAEVQHWNTAHAVAARAVQEAERRRAEQQEILKSGEARIAANRNRQAEIELAGEDMEARKGQLNAEELAASAQIETLQNEIEPAETELNSLEQDSAETQEVLAAAQQNVSVADRHASQAQLEFSKLREALDSLRRKVEDDFGLVAFEYNPEVSGPTPLPLEGMVEQLPRLVEIPSDLEDNISRQRSLLRRMGPINPEVQAEYRSVKERFEFLTAQTADLKKADSDLREVIAELDELMKREFRKTFDAVAAEFHVLFTRLFGGGSARLILNDNEDPSQLGIDIEARLPGRRDQGLSLLSGGERSLTAAALIFSLIKVSPTPFCVMDEVDAMLDEANVGRFRDLLDELGEKTQFILITHNRNTVQAADVIYGVTMGRDSASQVISLRLDELSDEMVK